MDHFLQMPVKWSKSCQHVVKHISGNHPISIDTNSFATRNSRIISSEKNPWISEAQKYNVSQVSFRLIICVPVGANLFLDYKYPDI